MIPRLFLAGLACLFLAGCDGAAPELRPEARQASPAIYEVTAPEGGTGWLFGTAHALPDGIDWRSEAIEDAIARSGVLVVEIANLADTQASFDAFRQHAYADGLPPLVDRAGPERRELIEELVERADGDPDDFAGMKTWAAAMTLASGIRTGDPENGVDRALIADSDKPVIGLETFEEQYAIFDALPADDQADLLAAMANEARANSGEALTEAWLTGNDELINERANAGLLAYPALRERLVADRNREWVDTIDTLIREGRGPFVAVGAAHVVGSQGLIAMLEERGYSVRRL